jgi:hypothetical protein
MNQDLHMNITVKVQYEPENRSKHPKKTKTNTRASPVEAVAAGSPVAARSRGHRRQELTGSGFHFYRAWFASAAI